MSPRNGAKLVLQLFVPEGSCIVIVLFCNFTRLLASSFRPRAGATTERLSRLFPFKRKKSRTRVRRTLASYRKCIQM